jgi:ribosome-associated translation inhibitor RaiA
MHVPGKVLKVEETTVNMFAAVDIVETKLRIALKKHKMTHANPRFHQRMLVRFKHRGQA